MELDGQQAAQQVLTEERFYELRVQEGIRRRDKLLSFGEHAVGVLANTVDGLFVVDPEDNFVCQYLLHGGKYREDEYERLRTLVREGGDVLVVGAHIGAHVIPLSRVCRHLVAIEANPRTFSYLQANLLLNQCVNVVAHNVAASDKVETLEFLMSSENSGGSKRMPLNVETMYVYDKPYVVSVNAVPLDQLVDGGYFDLVLMDIEGSEYFALKGMQRILAGTKALSVEFLAHHLKNVAGIGPEEFFSAVSPHFDWMWSPEDDTVVPIFEALSKISLMYDNEVCVDGLFFLKEPLPHWLVNGKESPSLPQSSMPPTMNWLAGWKEAPPLPSSARPPWRYFSSYPLSDLVQEREVSVREYCALARDFMSVNDMSAARRCYDTVLRFTNPPDTPTKCVARGEACQFMANEAHERGDDGEAIDWWNKALHADPLDLACRSDFITKGLLPMRWYALARLEVDRATRLAPDDPKGWQLGAIIEREDGDRNAMLLCLKRALAVGPDDAAVHLVASQCYADLAQYDEAEHHIFRAMELGSDRLSDAKHGLGLIRHRQCRPEEALQALDEAMELGGTKDDILLRWNRAEILLSLGRYAEGWGEHAIRFDNKYRGRDLSSFGQIGRRFAKPVWSMDDPPCRVHVHPTMGTGDVICMARYVPMLRQMCHEVSFEVDPRMVDLFAHSFPGVNVFEMAKDYPGSTGIKEFDKQITTMSFPHLFGTTIDTVPWNGPYITADSICVDRLVATMPFWKRSGRLKVGLCWSSGLRPGLWYTEFGRRKSMRFDELKPLLSTNVNFFSLQVGPEALENQIIPGLNEASYSWAAGPAWTTSKLDWSDTAAAIDQLDLVITVDTAVAHLAGAMGKPTWLMMHTQPNWHWMRERTDSPWYPSVRIFRQEKPHEWSCVVDAVRVELDQLVSQ